MAQDALDYKLVAIGGSAGSLDIILKIVTDLPDDKNIVYIIIVHRKNDGDSILTDILSKRTKMNVREVEDKEAIFPNTVYIAPADYHLLIENKQTFSLDISEKVHYSRPSIDVAFESIADTFGPAAIGILLSGANADGAFGLQCIKDGGGYTIVQDPNTAEVGFMPQQAINRNIVDSILHAHDIPSRLKELLR